MLVKAISNANRFVSCKNIFEAKVSVYVEKHINIVRLLDFSNLLLIKALYRDLPSFSGSILILVYNWEETYRLLKEEDERSFSFSLMFHILFGTFCRFTKTFMCPSDVPFSQCIYTHRTKVFQHDKFLLKNQKTIIYTVSYIIVL